MRLPGHSCRRGYNPTIQHLVNHGYAVLAVNNRGSSGYNKESRIRASEAYLVFLERHLRAAPAN